MQRHLIYKAITEIANQKKDIASVHVEDVMALCKAQSGKQVNLPYGCVAQKEFECLIFKRVDDCPDICKEIQISPEQMAECLMNGKVIIVPKETVGEEIRISLYKKEVESMEIPRKTYTKWLDYDKIKEGFCIRTRRSGDYFISDAQGHRKKLKQYFIDEKIPLTVRDKMWLLAQGQEVLWLIGGRMSEHIKVTHETKYIVEITYDGGKENE